MTNTTKVKICGITRLEDALLAEKLGANALGFIFAKSPRQISVTDAAKITKQLSPFTHRVGVFVNQEIDIILNTVKQAKLSIVQLHGDEDTRIINALQDIVTIKAFQVNQDSDFTEIEKCPADAILLDAYSKKARGGLGKVFNWDIIPKKLRKKIILAGGIGADNVLKAINKVCPMAVDASSLLEDTPGCKNHQKLKDFFNQIKLS